MLEKIRMQENILSLIESETVELKRELTDDVVKTVLAFANSGGERCSSVSRTTLPFVEFWKSIKYLREYQIWSEIPLYLM